MLDMSRNVMLDKADHVWGMLPVRPEVFLTLRSDKSLKADHAEGKLPLKPLPYVCNILRFVSILRSSKGPVSLGQSLRYNSVSFVRSEKD